METTKNTSKPPRYYQASTLSLIATVTNVFAWVCLLIAIFYAVIDLVFLDKSFLSLGLPPATHWWEWQNLTSWFMLESVIFPIILSILPLIGTFLLLKCASIGINVLLEIDFNLKANFEKEQDGESGQENGRPDDEDEGQPAFYNPEQLLSFASVVSKVAWTILLIAIGIALWKFLGNLSDPTAFMPFWTLLAIFLTELIKAVISFFMIIGVSKGLNVLMEFEYNSRGVK